MPGETAGRYALPDLHGPEPGHGPISLRTRCSLSRLRSSLRTLSIMPGRHRLLPDDIPPNRADAHRQAQSETAVGDDRTSVQQAADRGDKRQKNFRQRGIGGQQHLRASSRTRRVRKILQDCHLPRRESVLR